MEDKRLNFDQPLLSVRRFSSTLTSQNDEIKKADTIPRIHPHPHPSYKSELKSGPISNAGSVPFVWEHSPGRPKDEGSPQVHSTERPPTVPKLPPGKNLKPKKQDSDRVSKVAAFTNGPGTGECPSRSQLVVRSLEEKVTKSDCFKENLKEESSASGDGDEAYMDALDTLSRVESTFYNCSVGGLSELEADMKRSETFSVDPKTRDLMMDRFLPAARAMVSEAPQHTQRKPAMVWEQPRQVKKVVNADKRPPLQFGPNYAQGFPHDNAVEESDDDFEEHESTSFKVCGLLPRFALKSSFCLLNPVPGMCMRTRVPLSLGRTHASSFSAADSCNKSEIEPARVALYEQRPIDGYQAEGPNDTRFLKNESSRIPRHYDSQQLEGSTLYKRLQHSNDCISIPVEVIDAGISQNSKLPKSFNEFLADQIPCTERESGSPVAEKTLYVDMVHKMESQKRCSRSADMKGLPNLREAHTVLHPTSNNVQSKEIMYIGSSIKDIESLSIRNGESMPQFDIRNHDDLGMLSDESNEDVVIEIMKDFRQGGNCIPDSKTSITTTLSNVENSKNSHRSSSTPPAPPPLPKSPSDSWLWRTLPSVPSKNVSLRSYLGTGVKPSSKASSIDPKW